MKRIEDLFLFISSFDLLQYSFNRYTLLSLFFTLPFILLVGIRLYHFFCVQLDSNTMPKRKRNCLIEPATLVSSTDSGTDSDHSQDSSPLKPALQLFNTLPTDMQRMIMVHLCEISPETVVQLAICNKRFKDDATEVLNQYAYEELTEVECIAHDRIDILERRIRALDQNHTRTRASGIAFYSKVGELLFTPQPCFYKGLVCSEIELEHYASLLSVSAVFSKKVSTLQWLLDQRSRVKQALSLELRRALNLFETDNFALLEASVHGRREQVELLLSFPSEFDVHFEDGKGRSALYVSCEYGHPEIVRLLLRHGASVEQSDHSGRYPVHAAARGGHCEIIRALVTIGNASVDVCDDNLMFPIHLASSVKGNVDAVVCLASLGADLCVTDGRGWNALAFALVSAQDSAIATVLYDAGCRLTAPHYRLVGKLMQKNESTEQLKLLKIYRKSGTL
mmetsp:Transcript_7422/g.13401  ORF Transcript_7422/g.13401 Transcript_7422/m.13401 type:complete len:451 (-) Transcript_7422:714-2066(-)